MSKRLPFITSNIPRDLRNFVDRVRELIASTGSDRLASVKELADVGLVNVNALGELSLANAPEVYGTPPAPQNFTATAAIRNVILEWDAPVYPHHAYSEVWGASTDDRSTAVLLGQTPGAVYTDALGPSSTRYYWVRFINTQYVAGAYNDLAGTSATTGADLAYTMDLLTDVYGGTSEAPYFILDAEQEIDGVMVPAGVYMKAAFIFNGEITNAKIGEAAIDEAKIADLAVTNAKIADATITNAKIGDAEIDVAKIDVASITSLSALSADMGTITAGLMQSADGEFVIDLTNKYISISV